MSSFLLCSLQQGEFLDYTGFIKMCECDGKLPRRYMLCKVAWNWSLPLSQKHLMLIPSFVYTVKRIIVGMVSQSPKNLPVPQILLKHMLLNFLEDAGFADVFHRLLVVLGQSCYLAEEDPNHQFFVKVIISYSALDFFQEENCRLMK